MRLSPTPRHAVLRDGSATLMRFTAASGRTPAAGSHPLLIVPSLINRWTLIDLHEGASVVEALVEGGIDVFAIDWGRPRDEDRHLGWDDVVLRVERFARAVRRTTGARSLGLMGYSLGGTLAAITAALNPDRCGALVALAAPIDFALAGVMRTLVDRRWFDVEALAAAGNIAAEQVHTGMLALRPTLGLGIVVRWLDGLGDPEAHERLRLYRAWLDDIVPFPAAAYARYITALYQDNELVRGVHCIEGRHARLERITAPTMTVVAEGDVVCPPAAGLALQTHATRADHTTLRLEGGHVSAVINEHAPEAFYAPLTSWLQKRLAAPRPKPLAPVHP